MLMHRHTHEYTHMNTRTCMRTLMCTHTDADRQSHALETLAPGSLVLLSGHREFTSTLLCFHLGTWLALAGGSYQPEETRMHTPGR